VLRGLPLLSMLRLMGSATYLHRVRVDTDWQAVAVCSNRARVTGSSGSALLGDRVSDRISAGSACRFNRVFVRYPAAPAAPSVRC